MSFSVLIRTHDRPSDLKKALYSVLNQKMLPEEIFVLDDLNQKIIKEIVHEIERKNLVRIVYFNTLNKHNSLKNLNIVSEKSSGQFLAFLDDDDTWDKNYLYKSYSFIKNNNIDIIYTNFLRVYEKTNHPFEIKRLSFKENVLTNNGFLISNLIVKKNVFQSLGGFDFSLSSSADKDFYLNALMKKKFKISIQKDFLINYTVFKKPNEWKWSDDDSKIVSAKLKFYRKYFLKLDLYLHLRMLIKILKIFLSIFLSVFFKTK